MAGDDLEFHRNDAALGAAEADVHVLEPLRMERMLRTSVPPIDDLLDGFRSSKVTLFEGNCGYPSSLMHLLCVKAVSELDEEVVWIDGGNSVDPYSLSALCKRMRLDKRDVLSRVNISRAFTAYQLVTLIDERLEEVVRESSPAMVIVSSLTDMFLDKDMKWMEAYQLLRRCAEDIRRVTRAYETISLVTDRTPGHVPHNERMLGVLRAEADTVVSVRERRDGMLVRLPREDRSIAFRPVPWNQMTLPDFGEDAHGEDGSDIQAGT
jgi:KaiC/GvpD/RAD55 family RecA-like ATPase